MNYYAIVRISEEGTDILDGYDTYEAAEEKLDGYFERYPNAFIDILYASDL
jgi:hypothetical protein